MSKFSQYQAFIAVVEQGGITAAASILNLSVPAISKQIALLEENLQVQLFFRSHKKLEISVAGKDFYPKCKAILLSVAQAEEAVLSEQDNMSGPISITLSNALCRSPILDICADFSKLYPAIKFNLYFSDELEDLYGKDIDFAFRLGKLNDSSSMTATTLSECQLVACATADYLEQYGKPKSFSEPGQARFILMSPLNPTGELKAFLNKKRLNYTHSVAHRTNDIEGIYRLVSAHLGIGLMLDISIQKELNEGKFMAVLAEHKLPSKALHLLSKKSQWQTRRLKVFKEHVKATFA